MISAWELAQVAFLVCATAVVAAACERWGTASRLAKVHTAAASAAGSKTATSDDLDDAIAEPELPKSAAARKAVPEPAPKAVAPKAPAPTPAAASAPPAIAANSTAANDDDLDALLDSALDAEAEADSLLDDLLAGDAKEGSTAAAKDGDAAASKAAPKPKNDAAPAKKDSSARLAEGSGAVAQSLTGVRTEPALTGSAASPSPRAEAEGTSSPSQRERGGEAAAPAAVDSMDDLLESALDEVGHSDALLDECLEKAAAASAGNPDDRRSSPAKRGGSTSGGSSSSHAAAAADKADKGDRSSGSDKGAADSGKGRSSKSGRLHVSSSGEHDSARVELVFPVAMRSTKRPNADPARAVELMRMGRELLELRKHQAALDTLCSAHRFVDLGNDPHSLRNTITAGIRAVYLERDEEAKFGQDALPFL